MPVVNCRSGDVGCSVTYGLLPRNELLLVAIATVRVVPVALAEVAADVDVCNGGVDEAGQRLGNEGDELRTASDLMLICVHRGEEGGRKTTRARCMAGTRGC